jgi:uncharacterized RDD family membrane protein YckC
MNDGRIQISTPEGVVFAYSLAGPVSRLLAWIIDLLCVLVLSSLAGALLSWLQLLSVDFVTGLALLVNFALQILYSILLEWYWRGQTIGKRLMAIRVIDVEGLKLQPQQVILRNLLRAIDQAPVLYLVGGIMMLLNRRRQRLGDWVANTVVIRMQVLAEPDLNLTLPAKFNSLLAYPHLAARLAQRASAHDAWLALEAVRRRDAIDPQARLGLFAELAAHFRDMVDFPPEAYEGISDEQYVRNVAGVLFRNARKQADKEPRT